MEIDRRTVTRAAIWSLPVITLAEAAPAYAASQTPTCPTCLTASGGAFTEQIVVAGNTSTAVTAGTLAFNLDSSTCNVNLFQPAYTVVGTSVTVAYGGTAGSQSQTFSTAAITGAGTFGQLSVLSAAFSIPTTNISMPNDTNPPYNPVFPTSITIRFNAIFVGLPSLISITCPYTVTFSLSTTNTGTVGTLLGTGTVNYTGTASGGGPI